MYGFFGALFSVLLFILWVFVLCFGIRLHYNAMKALIDALDEVSGGCTSTFMRMLVLVLTTILFLASCGTLLVLDIIIILIRANKKA